MDFQTSALILAWMAILVLALAMSGLLRQVQALSRSRAPQWQIGPPVGSVAPPLRPDDQWGSDTVTVALFLDRACEACRQSLQLAEQFAVSNAGRLRFLAVFPEGANGHQQRQVEVIENADEAFTKYQIPVTPFGVVIGPDGRIVQTSPLGSESLFNQLVERTLQRG
jgi:hypothetical protein